MYVNLIEIQHIASDIRSRQRYRERIILETLKDTEKNCAKLHRKRVKMITKGQNAIVVRTVLHPSHVQYGQNRRARRLNDRLLRRLLRRMRRGSTINIQPKRRPDDIEAALKEEFRGRRSKSGLVVPGEGAES